MPVSIIVIQINTLLLTLMDKNVKIVHLDVLLALVILIALIVVPLLIKEVFVKLVVILVIS